MSDAARLKRPASWSGGAAKPASCQPVGPFGAAPGRGPSGRNAARAGALLGRRGRQCADGRGDRRRVGSPSPGVVIASARAPVAAGSTLRRAESGSRRETRFDHHRDTRDHRDAAATCETSDTCAASADTTFFPVITVSYANVSSPLYLALRLFPSGYRGQIGSLQQSGSARDPVGQQGARKKRQPR